MADIEQTEPTMPVETRDPDVAQTSSRRAFLTGATAVGISAIAASYAPAAVALTNKTSPRSGDPVKMLAVIRRRPDLSKAEFYDYWLNRHGPLATRMIKELGGYRYVQSHTSNEDLGLVLASSRGQIGQAYDGVTEVWFRSREALVKALATPAGAQANLRLARDETNFIDLPRSSYFLTTEYVLLG
jgi:hypothetical protein